MVEVSPDELACPSRPLALVAWVLASAAASFRRRNRGSVVEEHEVAELEQVELPNVRKL